MMARESWFSAFSGHIRERCKMLHYIQFVEPIYGDAYELTKDEQMYLDGEMDTRDRAWSTVDRAERVRSNE